MFRRARRTPLPCSGGRGGRVGAAAAHSRAGGEHHRPELQGVGGGGVPAAGGRAREGAREAQRRAGQQELRAGQEECRAGGGAQRQAHAPPGGRTPRGNIITVLGPL
eukprot:5781753-Pyramimonas_sp.AAC.1